MSSSRYQTSDGSEALVPTGWRWRHLLRRSNRSLDPILLVLLAGSLVLNVYFYRYAPTSAAPSLSSLRVGDAVPPLVGRDLRGIVSTVTFEQRPVVLYVFSPMCIWCDRNLRNISHLAESLATRYEFVGVVLEPDGVREYLEAHALNWRVITELEPDLRQRYRLGSTPQTIVVARGGEVLHVWSGAFVERTARQVEQVFGIELPGLGGDK